MTSIPIAGNCYIKVAAGTYTENTAGTPYLLLNRSFESTVIVEPQSDDVVLQGDGTGLASILIGSNAQNVEFRGLTITNNGSDHTILAANGSTNIASLVWRDCTINNTKSGGLCVFFSNVGAESCGLADCAISASGAGSTQGVSLKGKASASLYVSNFFLNTCIVSASQFALGIETGNVRHLTVTGGTYIAGSVSIGAFNAAWSGVSDLVFDGVTTRGNGRGFDLGGVVGSHLVNVTLLNCDVDASANKKIGVYIQDYVDNLTINGGLYVGGDLNGFGGFGSLGPNNTNFVLEYATFSSIFDEQESNGLLACGVGGVTELYVHHCLFTGKGRGLTLQDEVHDALIEYNTSVAEDFGLRIGHDAVDSPYDISNVICRFGQITSLSTPGVVIGEGVANCTIEDYTIVGGDGCMRLRGNDANANILIQRIQMSRNPLGSGTSAIVEMLGAQNVIITDSDIESNTSPVFSTSLEGTLTCKDTSITGNRITQGGGTVYNVGVDTLDSGVVFDDNEYTVIGGTFGSILGTSVTTLADAQTAWNSYGDGTNDDNSNVV